MNKSTYITLGTLGLFIVLAIGFGISMFSWAARETRLHNAVDAKIQDRDVVFDNTWKILQQQAGVTVQYKNAFKEAYASLMSERYKEGEAQVAKIVQEANPNFDSGLYNKLFDSIQEQRSIFTNNQRDLIALNKEHTDMVTSGVGGIYASILGRSEIKLNLITSERTKEAARTGEDNDVELFPKEQATPTPAPTPAPTQQNKKKNATNNQQMPIILSTNGK